ncbi:hypothetical protein ABW19_dt0202582 [Dactylella cylindrospora]|nr:hypothetical protein ABW19_dt0202582 [Dactylella cylindrospora]
MEEAKQPLHCGYQSLLLLLYTPSFRILQKKGVFSGERFESVRFLNFADFMNQGLGMRKTPQIAAWRGPSNLASHGLHYCWELRSLLAGLYPPLCNVIYSRVS